MKKQFKSHSSPPPPPPTPQAIKTFSFFQPPTVSFWYFFQPPLLFHTTRLLETLEYSVSRSELWLTNNTLWNRLSKQLWLNFSGFQKYLTQFFWACKSTHTPYLIKSFWLINTNNLPWTSGKFGFALTIILLPQTKRLTKWAINLHCKGTSRDCSRERRLLGIWAVR